MKPFEPKPLYFNGETYKVVAEPLGQELAAELLPMLKAHYEELEGPTAPPFNPDVERYLERGKRGLLLMIVARETFGEAVGVLLFRLDKSPIHQCPAAVEEFWYIMPEHRGTALARGMIEYFESVARDLGLAELYMGYSKKDASALYKRAGLTLMATLYGKVLTHVEKSCAS